MVQKKSISQINKAIICQSRLLALSEKTNDMKTLLDTQKKIQKQN